MAGGDTDTIDDLERPVRRSVRRSRKVTEAVELASQLPLPPKSTGDDSRADVARDICPITHAPFECPVILETGVTYEKAAIQRWLLKNRVCPVTRRPLHVLVNLLPNRLAGGNVYGHTEAFITGPLSSSDLLPLFAWIDKSPAILQALLSRLRLDRSFALWRLADAAVIFPKLAAMFHEDEAQFTSADIRECYETLFESMLGHLSSSVVGIVAMRILADSCLMAGAELLDTWHYLGEKVMRIPRESVVSGAEVPV